jgi:hypothetical protein
MHQINLLWYVDVSCLQLRSLCLAPRERISAKWPMRQLLLLPLSVSLLLCRTTIYVPCTNVSTCHIRSRVQQRCRTLASTNDSCGSKMMLSSGACAVFRLFPREEARLHSEMNSVWWRYNKQYCRTDFFWRWQLNVEIPSGKHGEGPIISPHFLVTDRWHRSMSQIDGNFFCERWTCQMRQFVLLCFLCGKFSQFQSNL